MCVYVCVWVYTCMDVHVRRTVRVGCAIPNEHRAHECFYKC